ncbi:MAG: gamma-glutamylcyclotransferase [Bdellovibrionaceae bacterium]|nr:gamma-glutamylcyclotransferase [Pseudobdellovibrionaceae bacterium]
MPNYQRLLFVYGSLKRGHSNHDRMTRYGGVFLGSVETVEGYELRFLHRGMAGVATMTRAHSGTVIGELYRVPDIRPLNVFEGHPHYYRLEPIIIKNENNQTKKVWAYIFQELTSLNARDSSLIVDGYYRERDWIFTRKG